MGPLFLAAYRQTFKATLTLCSPQDLPGSANITPSQSRIGHDLAPKAASRRQTVWPCRRLACSAPGAGILVSHACSPRACQRRKPPPRQAQAAPRRAQAVLPPDQLAPGAAPSAARPPLLHIHSLRRGTDSVSTRRGSARRPLCLPTQAPRLPPNRPGPFNAVAAAEQARLGYTNAQSVARSRPRRHSTDRTTPSASTQTARRAGTDFRPHGHVDFPPSVRHTAAPLATVTSSPRPAPGCPSRPDAPPAAVLQQPRQRFTRSRTPAATLTLRSPPDRHSIYYTTPSASMQSARLLPPRPRRRSLYSRMGPANPRFAATHPAAGVPRSLRGLASPPNRLAHTGSPLVTRQPRPPVALLAD